MRVDALIFIPFLTHTQETVTYIGRSFLKNAMAWTETAIPSFSFFKATKLVSTNHLKLHNYCFFH